MKAAKQINFISLLVYSVMLGLLGGATTIAFIFLFETLQDFLWRAVPNFFGISEESIYPIIICGVGGLILGLLIKHLGNYPKSIEEAIKSFKKTKKFDYKHIWQAFVISIVSLGFGAALGPEAALTSIIGGFATFISIKLDKLALLRYAAETDSKYDRPKRTLFRLVALASGLLLFKQFGSSGYFNLHLPSYYFEMQDLYLFVLPLFTGIVAAIFYIYTLDIFEQSLKDILKKQVVIATVIGGLLLGFLAIISSDALFSGHEAIPGLIANFSTNDGSYFVSLVLVKVMAVSICLATGWKGGRFFPLMFIGSAAGLLASTILPDISPVLGLCVGMSATLAFVLKRPLVSIVVLLFFFPINLYPMILLAVFGASFANKIAVKKFKLV